MSLRSSFRALLVNPSARGWNRTHSRSFHLRATTTQKHHICDTSGPWSTSNAYNVLIHGTSNSMERCVCAACVSKRMLLNGRQYSTTTTTVTQEKPQEQQKQQKLAEEGQELKKSTQEGSSPDESSEEILHKLTKESKTAHLLKQKTIADRLQSLGEKTWDVTKKVPGWSARILVAIAKSLWSFAMNPSVAADWLTSVKIKAKKEAMHYWDGFKLLGADARYALSMVKRVTKGHTLSRRERRQLEKTAADLFRLVPFAVFVLVPFMEFLLPVALKLFPKMLPSQFENKLKKEEELKKKVKAQLELAKFLQDTVEAMTYDLKRSESKETVTKADDLEKFIDKCRKGEMVHNEDIVRFAKLFSDEIALDSISRAQLVAMCKYMSLSPFGTDAYLRMKLRNKLRKLKADDRFIYWEGTESLSLEELMFACQERGMKIGLPKQELRRQLKEWIELSLDKNIPSSLLILSRAFTYTDIVQSEEAIKMALGTLSDDVVQEVTLDSTVSSEDDKNINRRKLDSLKRQQKLIDQEMEENQRQLVKREERRKRHALEGGLSKVHQIPGIVSGAVVLPTGAEETTKPSTEEFTSDETDRLGKEDFDLSEEFEEQHEEKEEEDLKELITVMAYSSSLTNERAEFDELLDKHSTSVESTKELEGKTGKMTELNTRIANMLRKIDETIDRTDLSIGTELNLLDKDKDGVISVAEVEQSLKLLKEKPSEATLRDIIQRLDHDRDGRISINELVLELKEARAKERLQEEF